LPAGANATFNPASVSGSGASTMSVTTATTTPTGSFTLTITGTGGSTVHSTVVTLVVTASSGGPDFAISATPASQTIARGTKGTYTVTVTALNGFKSSVSLKVSGLPAKTNTQFVPAFLTGSGTSTMTVFPQSGASPGTATLTITGTSGSLVHSTTVVVTVK